MLLKLKGLFRIWPAPASLPCLQPWQSVRPSTLPAGLCHLSRGGWQKHTLVTDLAEPLVLELEELCKSLTNGCSSRSASMTVAALVQSYPDWSCTHPSVAGGSVNADEPGRLCVQHRDFVIPCVCSPMQAGSPPLHRPVGMRTGCL